MASSVSRFRRVPAASNANTPPWRPAKRTLRLRVCSARPIRKWARPARSNFTQQNPVPENSDAGFWHGRNVRPKDSRTERSRMRSVNLVILNNQREDTMNKDRVEGSIEQAKGQVKEVAGKVTGDSKLETEGNADQVSGKIKNAVGGIKDTVKEALDH